jgi:indolepyruvate ferredoxin oxidoreductase
MLSVLAELRGLRGTAFDPFGRTAERQTGCRLIAEYEAMLDEILALDILGFGDARKLNLRRAKVSETDLFARFRSPAPQAMAAE